MEKLEDIKGLCNLMLLTSDTIANNKNEQLPSHWRVFKNELERKREVLQNKVKGIEQEQETNKAELDVRN